MLKSYPIRALSLFFILGFLFIPLSFLGFDYQYLLTRFFFLKPVAFLQSHFFPNALPNIDFSSDTIGLNLLLALLLVLALLFIWLLDTFKIKTGQLVTLFKSVSYYYIALALLKYGFDKVFKQQFYLPEPNILYSNFGSLNKDILFWSTIGLSHTYSVVTGLAEVVTALLILVKPTRVLGFCLAIGVLVNIILINFSFDISVKTFSSFLLAVVLFNVYPYLKTFYAFFIQRKQVQLALLQNIKPVYGFTHIVLGIGLVCYAGFPYVWAGNFNGDKSERPPLHGAYTITRFTIGNDTLNKADFPYKRVFIHSNNYIIFELPDDKMVDYHFDIDPVNKQLLLQDYHQNKINVLYSYDEKTGLLRLTFNNKNKSVIDATVLNWKALPALRDEMHYTIDEIR